MRGFLYRSVAIAGIMSCLLLWLSCGHDQQLASIQVQPGVETFGASNIPVSANAGLSVQLRALGTYIHPPATKDITNQVTWKSNDIQMVTVNSTGLITATGVACGGTLISATVQTNKSVGGQSSSGAIVTGTMSANVTCFTGASTSVVLTITFLGSGKGTVTVLPSGFICSATCGIPFAPGAGPITLTAAAGGTFGGWTNCPSATGTVCTISSITNNTDIDATFN
jgi:Bacterial Ig-like domain (group 2)